MVRLNTFRQDNCALRAAIYHHNYDNYRATYAIPEKDVANLKIAAIVIGVAVLSYGACVFCVWFVDRCVGGQNGAECGENVAEGGVGRGSDGGGGDGGDGGDGG